MTLNSATIGAIAGGVSGGVLLIVLVIICVLCFYKSYGGSEPKRKRRYDTRNGYPIKHGPPPPFTMSMSRPPPYPYPGMYPAPPMMAAPTPVMFGPGMRPMYMGKDATEQLAVRESRDDESVLENETDERPKDKTRYQKRPMPMVFMLPQGHPYLMSSYGPGTRVPRSPLVIQEVNSMPSSVRHPRTKDKKKHKSRSRSHSKHREESRDRKSDTVEINNNTVDPTVSSVPGDIILTTEIVERSSSTGEKFITPEPMVRPEEPTPTSPTGNYSIIGSGIPKLRESELKRDFTPKEIHVEQKVVEVEVRRSDPPTPVPLSQTYPVKRHEESEYAHVIRRSDRVSAKYTHPPRPITPPPRPITPPLPRRPITPPFDADLSYERVPTTSWRQPPPLAPEPLSLTIIEKTLEPNTGVITETVTERLSVAGSMRGMGRDAFSYAPQDSVRMRQRVPVDHYSSPQRYSYANPNPRERKISSEFYDNRSVQFQNRAPEIIPRSARSSGVIITELPPDPPRGYIPPAPPLPM